MSLVLESGTIVADRFRIESILGRGGFANTYLAQDLAMDRKVVVKELCPPGSVRKGDTLLIPEGEHIPHQFLREAKTLARLRLDGVVQIFDAFRWGGTVYSIMEHVAHAKDLAQEIQALGPMEPERVRRMLIALCDSLQEVHQRGFLHRDIKPSNVLLLPNDRPVLIDFGSAREWHADKTVQHTVMFTPGYTPIEQLGTAGRRGPESDLYSLGATAYEMLTGVRPASSADRVSGVELVPIRRVRPEVPEELSAAIEHALALHSWQRPGTAAELRAELTTSGHSNKPISSTLEEMDQKTLALQKLKYGKKECPACSGVLDTPNPLKVGACPVCRHGKLTKRDIDERRCPICRTGVLKELKNSTPIKICPFCKSGRLHTQGLLKKSASCPICTAMFSRDKNELTVTNLGSSRSDLAETGTAGDSDEFWLPLSGRSARVVYCETCSAEWDELAGGDLRLFSWRDDPFGIARRFKSLSRGEWARVAIRLQPDAGNVVCARCNADYFAEGGSLTLLDAEHDAFGFAAEYQGRRIPEAALRFIGVDKSSGMPGPVCSDCKTEFDAEGDYLRLRATGNRALRPHIDQAKPFEDWHRLAKGLPAIDEEAEWSAQFDGILRSSLLSGAIPWVDRKKPDLLWRSDAELIDEHARGRLSVYRDLVEFRAKKCNWSAPLDVIRSISMDGEEVVIRAVGESEALRFRIDPQDVAADLASGRREVTLTAADLIECLTLLRA